MVYLIVNEASWAIVNYKKWHSRLFKDEVAEFLTKMNEKTARIRLDVVYLT